MDRQYISMLKLIILLSFVLVVSGCIEIPITPESSAAAQATIQPSTVRNAVVAAEGIIVPVRDADLSFQIAGQVNAILVSEGELVTKDQPLIQLDKGDLEQVVAEARAGLDAEKARLEMLRAGSRREEVAAAQARLAIATTAVTSAEAAVKIAEGNLAAAQADAAVAEDAVSVAEGNLAAAQAALRSAQANLSKVRAGATQIQRSIAEKRVEQAKNELYGLQQQRDVSRNTLAGQIAAAEVAVEIAQLQLQELDQGARKEDVAIAQAQVSEANAGIQTAEAQVAQAQSQALQAAAGVDVAAAQVEKAKAQVESAKAQQKQAQAELDLIKAGSRREDIAIAEAAVAQATARLASTEKALDDATLRAPFDGTIGALFVDEGELVAPQQTVIRVGDLSRFQVQTEDLSEVDVAELLPGQTVIVTVDALDGRVYNGSVSRVAPLATDHRGDKVYTVVIDLTDDLDTGLRWGMSTFVEIQVR